MDNDTIKAIKDIICDALASAQPQVTEEFAKATLKSIASRLSEIVNASSGLP